MNGIKDKQMSNIEFTQGTNNLFKLLDEKENLEPIKQIKFIKEKLKEFFNLKNVNFLFGAGSSADAIPTMKELYQNLVNTLDDESKNILNSISATNEGDLEGILTVLYSARNYYAGLSQMKDEEKKKEEKYKELINKIEKYIFNSINITEYKDEKKKVLELYKSFYRKIALRNKDLSRVRIFTTNNDMLNETALDAEKINFINGFSGGIRKMFNPALFNYTWSKRIDTSIDKYEPTENMVYLYKLHGSINWRYHENEDNCYFNIEEVIGNDIKYSDAMLIYPTPTKQDKSLGSPYLELFREFQNKLLEPHSVLFIIGYGFNDYHVNDIIYRGLATNSTLNVVIFGEKPKDDDKKKKPIFFIDDNRIYRIAGKINDEKGEETINHFEYIVNSLLPNLDAFSKEEALIRNFVKKLKEIGNKKNENRENSIY